MTTGGESPRRLRLQGVVVILATFLIGGLVGVTVDRAVGPHAPARRLERSERRDHLPPRFERLDLSADQRGRIRAIFESRRPRTDSIMSDVMVQIGLLRDSVRAEIDSVLTPEQRTRLADESSRFDGSRRGRFRRDRLGPLPRTRPDSQ